MSQTEPEAGIDMPDEQLNRAIEELRGVLKEEQNRPAEAVRAGKHLGGGELGEEAVEQRRTRLRVYHAGCSGQHHRCNEECQRRGHRDAEIALHQP